MSEGQERNGWNEWSKHIINELIRLNNSTEKLREELQMSNLEITKLKAMEKELLELKQGIAAIKDNFEKSGYHLEKKIDKRILELISEISNSVEEIKQTKDVLIKKVEKLEGYKNYTWGIGIAVVAIITFLISILALFDWGPFA